jgi:hypothetical protein
MPWSLPRARSPPVDRVLGAARAVAQDRLDRLAYLVCNRPEAWPSGTHGGRRSVDQDGDDVGDRGSPEPRASRGFPCQAPGSPTPRPWRYPATLAPGGRHRARPINDPLPSEAAAGSSVLGRPAAAEVADGDHRVAAADPAPRRADGHADAGIAVGRRQDHVAVRRAGHERADLAGGRRARRPRDHLADRPRPAAEVARAPDAVGERRARRRGMADAGVAPHPGRHRNARTSGRAR